MHLYVYYSDCNGWSRHRYRITAILSQMMLNTALTFHKYHVINADNFDVKP